MEKKIYNQRKSAKRIGIYIVCIALLTLVDQWTKMLAVQHLKNQSAFVIVKNVFEFYYLENTGAAWGMMSGARIFFLILTIVIVAVIFWALMKIPGEKKYLPLQISAVLLCSGALGNFMDRLLLGYVRDFVYFRLINFPIFNVADTYVTIGVAIFAVLILFIYQETDFEFIKRK